MRRDRKVARTTSLLGGVGVLLALVLVPGGVTFSSFSSATANPGNQVSAAADWVPPTASPTVIAKTTGYLTGAVKPGGKYYVYANVTDGGNPPSGTASSTSNVSAITSDQTAVTLTAGTYSVGGTSYNRRSGELTAASLLSAGNYSYSIACTDAATNTGTQSGLPVTVDATAPAGSDVQTANGGGNTVGKAEQGDQIIITYDEQIDPHSILAGWTGASTKIVVRLTQGGLLGFLNDTVTIHDETNTTQLPYGAIDLGRLDYVASSSVTFGETAAPSRMVQSGNVITITLGRLVGGTPATAGGAGSMTWTPSCAAYDAAGNSCATAMGVTEGGAADKEF